MLYAQTYDVLVIGGGHAGTEAALAAARMGAQVLLLTHNIETIGQMSCNPAIGGIGKGHLVKEIDALGGIMGRAADYAGIQFRTLNSSKGPAVRATRIQADRSRYKTAIRTALETQTGLQIFQQAVDDLIIENEHITGAITQMGLVFRAKAVILTIGTFLGGRIHIGMTHYPGGRAGDPPANALAQRLRNGLFQVERLKTGTPPRIDGRSIDYQRCIEQPGDHPPSLFSCLSNLKDLSTQVNCYITHTTAQTHELIRGGLSRSPLYSGVIEGVGPRYCPSIEDKVVRFNERESHQIFLEPEGLHTTEVYPNGISTSLPFDIQWALVRSLPGLENAHLTRPGYAIEYDFFDPRDLRPSLETKAVRGLFFAGQINGTTGYEEAAAQGLLAGVNAVRYGRGESPWIPRRDEAYLGVLIDDLITQGTREPYRMFTSRAEYRLLLREDNADLRLTEQGRALGLINDTQWGLFARKRELLARERQRLHEFWVRPEHLNTVQQFALLGSELHREIRALDLLARPNVSYVGLMHIPNLGPGVDDPKVAEQLEIQCHYAGYIERQYAEIERQRAHETMSLPDDLDYTQVRGLSTEVREKLIRHRPATLGQAGRIAGVTPAAISLLLIHLKRRSSSA